ncbi:MAG: tyrosine-type recombinase/integrase [Bacteroidales bacterium]
MDSKESFYKYLINELGYSNNTLKSYKIDLQQFEEFCTSNFGDFLFTHINVVNIRLWIIRLMQNGLSPKSVRRKVSVLRVFHRYLQTEGIATEPLGQVRLPKMQQRLPTFVKTKEMDMMFRNKQLFNDSFEGKRDRAVMLLLYATGMRVGELVSLRKDDVDLLNCTIKVIGKGRKQRLIPFPKTFISQLQDYKTTLKDIGESPYFVITSKGKQTYPMLIYRVVSKILKLVSSSGKVNPHILRHTYATHLLNNGADLNAVKELLGHKSLSATEVYTHNTIDRLKSVYKKSHPWAED